MNGWLDLAIRLSYHHLSSHKKWPCANNAMFKISPRSHPTRRKYLLAFTRTSTHVKSVEMRLFIISTLRFEWKASVNYSCPVFLLTLTGTSAGFLAILSNISTLILQVQYYYVCTCVCWTLFRNILYVHSICMRVILVFQVTIIMIGWAS